jgi:PH (Pleckstrin Homology) domain-containing protein
MRFAATRFRPTFGRALSVVVAVIVAATLIGFAAAGDWNSLARYGGGLLLAVATAVALYWLPSLDVAEHEITVRNVFSTVHVPWPAIQRIDTKYALTLYTPAGKVTAWASPAPNRYAAQASSAVDARLAAGASGTHPRPGDLPDTTSGAAAFVIRRHWEQLNEDGHLDAPVIEAGTLRREIHWATIAVLTALTVATVVGIGA